MTQNPRLTDGSPFDYSKVLSRTDAETALKKLAAESYTALIKEPTGESIEGYDMPDPVLLVVPDLVLASDHFLISELLKRS